jgi:hypothetical protein
MPEGKDLDSQSAPRSEEGECPKTRARTMFSTAAEADLVLDTRQ